MTAALTQLDADMSKSKVKSLENNSWITPLSSAQPEPLNLLRLKVSEICKRWPMTSLLDIFKEADLRIQSLSLERGFPRR